ncbi:phage terminase small subunit [Bacillus sp. AFS017336]|uniref:phage terminase small subunit n=1 Tax=Bacillus sp. AFS017336 TaxID=2033489 RepID=UPI000BF1A9D4|nr:phage terminase small subunit [Bacillus sp. AFS017336]PEL12679.1 hypothetical protein CN601_06955 [Bacillus sp. AFS017336]
MAREKNPNREKAFNIFRSHNGNITNREIAKQIGEDEKKVAVWKQRDKWNVVQQTENNVVQQTKRPRGAPKGSKNALGNKGGHGGPVGNNKAVKHGFFAKYLPKESLDIIEELQELSPLDILWQQINIQYAAIIRAQRIMFVKDQADMTKELKKTKVTDTTSEEEYEIQFAWDKHANFLQAQSRAIGELRSLIRQFDDMANIDDERKLKLEQMRVSISKTKLETKLLDPEDNDSNDDVIDNFNEATKPSAEAMKDVFGDENED